MKILKPGKVEQRKFVCPKCGCVFVAKPSDIVTAPFDDDEEWMCCPDCGYPQLWDNGEPYEEPTDQDDIVEKIADLIYSDFGTDADTAWKIGAHLVKNGVTFKGE